MAHFAKLGVGNIIERVIVVSNDIATTEQAGVDFLNNLYNTRDVWKQTSYNGNIRKNYAGIGYIMTKLEMLLYHLNLLTLGY
jgi:DNA phosphorothioation-dependent restriction protein DptG